MLAQLVFQYSRFCMCQTSVCLSDNVLVLRLSVPWCVPCLCTSVSLFSYSLCPLCLSLCLCLSVYLSPSRSLSRPRPLPLPLRVFPSLSLSRACVSVCLCRVCACVSAFTGVPAPWRSSDKTCLSGHTCDAATGRWVRESLTTG